MKKLLLFISLAFTILLGACDSGNEAVGEQIAAADEAIDAGNYDEAQQLLDEVVNRGLDGLTETNLGNLSVQYMRLSEHTDGEDNVSTAVECFREASHISTDSLRTFSSSLEPDELAHFYLAKRILSGIENPVDLTAEEFTAEDSVELNSSEEQSAI